MCLGNITDEEIADAKANLVTAYKSFKDKPASIINLSAQQQCTKVDFLMKRF